LNNITGIFPLASAHLLGNDTALIANNICKKYIFQILNNNLNTDKTNKLIESMCDDTKHEYVEKFNLLQAFTNGFKNCQKPC
jgi:hypothetical protein